MSDLGERYRFGRFELHVAGGVLIRDGHAIALTPQPMAALVCLVRASGRMVTRDTLRQAVWGNRVVDFDTAINSCIRQVRAALGDRASAPMFIETIPNRGYRFIAPTSVVSGGPSPSFRSRTAVTVTVLAAALAGVATAGWLAWRAVPAPPRVAPLPAASPAERVYALGLAYLDRRTQYDDLRRATDLLERATVLDPSMAPAHAHLAIARITGRWIFGDTQEFEGAHAAATAAATLAPTDPLTQLARGYLFRYDRPDPARAMSAFQGAASTHDGGATLVAMAGTLSVLGRSQEAVPLLERAWRADSTSYDVLRALAATHQWLGAYDDAERWWQRAEARAPHMSVPYLQHAFNHVLADADVEGARRILAEGARRAGLATLVPTFPRLVRIITDSTYRATAQIPWYPRGAAEDDLLARAIILERIGRLDASRARYDSLRRSVEATLRPDAPRDHGYARRQGWLARAYAGLGDVRALDYARRAVNTVPPQDDALSGVDYQILLAETHARVGHPDSATAHFATALTHPAMISPTLLSVDPLWGSLRIRKNPPR